MAIHKCGRGAKPGTAVKQLQIAVRAGFEPGTSGFQVRRLNHSATLPPQGFIFSQRECNTLISLPEEDAVIISGLSSIIIVVSALFSTSLRRKSFQSKLSSFIVNNKLLRSNKRCVSLTSA